MASNADTELVTITIDGREMQVPEGQLLIEAAENEGEYIPRLCWHKRLRAVAICRMCLVEVDGMKGPQPACYTPVKEGMVVRHDTPGIKKAQEGVLEFLLINHPLDCPVCDRGGECELQDHTMSYGPGESRFVEEKRHFEKPIPVSDLVLLDRERCIQCDRCVRVASDVAGDPLLEFAKRGNQLHITTFPGDEFSSYFSGNTVQVCPVGALTATPYRFKARPWDVTAAETTCTGCSVGCRGALYETRNETIRLLGVDNDEVNWGWLCDKGRFGYESIDSPDRLVAPRLTREGRTDEVNWAEAVDRIASIVDAADGRIAAIGGARLTNEEAYALSKFMRSVCGSNDVDCQLDDGLPASYVAGIENRATIEDIESAAAIVLVCGDLKEELPVLYLRVRDAVAHHGVKLFVVGGQQSGLDQFVDADADIPDEGDVVVIVGRQSLTQSPDDVIAVANRAVAKVGNRAKLLPVVRRSNVHGAIDMGLAPDLLPGRVQVDDPAGRQRIAEAWRGDFPAEAGLDTRGILEAAADGDVDVLFIVGADPLNDFADPDLARRALDGASRVIVCDMFESELCEFADVVMPAAGWGEVDGTVTNIEGRVQSVTAKVTPPGQAASDSEVFRAVAERLGHEFGCGTPLDILTEISRVAIAYEGIDPSEFGHDSKTAGFLVTATSVEAPDPAESTSGRARLPGSLRLRVARTLYDQGTLVSHCPSLAALRPGAIVRMHPEDFSSRGIDPGSTLRLTSTDTTGTDTSGTKSGFSIEREAYADVGVARGEIFLPHAQGPMQTLTIGMTVNVEAL